MERDKRAGGSRRGRRPGGSKETRREILEAARVLFTERGYDQVGLRDVAAVVEVDASLVIRYFGSKERLFSETVAGHLGLGEDLLGGDRSDLGERLARYVLSKNKDRGEYDPLLALIRSASNEQAAALLREGADEQFVRPFGRWLGGESAEERAALVASCIVGLIFMRNVLGSGPLATGETEHLVKLVAPALQAHINGPDS